MKKHELTDQTISVDISEKIRDELNDMVNIQSVVLERELKETLYGVLNGEIGDIKKNVNNYISNMMNFKEDIERMYLESVRNVTASSERNMIKYVRDVNIIMSDTVKQVADMMIK